MYTAEWSYSSTSSSTLQLDGVKRSVSRPGHFTAGEKVPGVYWIGDWICYRDGLVALEKGETGFEARLLGCPSRSLVTKPTV